MTGRGKPNTVTFQYKLTTIKLMRTYHTAVHTYQCTCQSRTKLYLTKSVHKRWEINFKYSFQSQKLWTRLLVILHLMTHRRRSVRECNSSFRCSETLSDVTEVYMYPQMQHHPPRSREVFRHWWVTIIKTPKVRKMTKATLFDSFYASYHNKTVNYVADYVQTAPTAPSSN